MIKVSLFSLSYRDAVAAGRLDLFGIIDIARALRLDGVDLEARQFASTTPEYLESLRMRAFEHGLKINYVGVRSDFGKSGGELQEEIHRVQEWIDVASFMRVPLIRIVGANIPEGETEETVWPRLRAAMQTVVTYGRQRGVAIGLHNHNHGAVPATGEQVNRLLDEIGDPYFMHILDTGQYRGSPGASGQQRSDLPATDELYSHIAATVPRAAVVRTKFYRIESEEERWLDYDRIFGILGSVGYNGWLSIVYEGWDVLPDEAAVPKAAACLRRHLGRRGL
ncbi:MAG: sugar phosphate isomerase/epimerase [Chloroflexi bacterium]|nr:sugar phosphate isomerase/epimerase [Chloroflexota bacterium]